MLHDFFDECRYTKCDWYSDHPPKDDFCKQLRVEAHLVIFIAVIRTTRNPLFVQLFCKRSTLTYSVRFFSEKSLLRVYGYQFFSIHLRIINASRINLHFLVTSRLVLVLYPHLDLCDLRLNDIRILYRFNLLSSNNSKQRSNHAVSGR